MYCQATLKKLNCSHNIDKYFEINTKWTKEDYCPSCLESIEDIEQHKQAQEDSYNN